MSDTPRCDELFNKHDAARSLEPWSSLYELQAEETEALARSLERELSAMAWMKAYAERYRWLRSDSDWDYPIVRLHYGDYSVAQGNELDAVIDAAISSAASEVK